MTNTGMRDIYLIGLNEGVYAAPMPGLWLTSNAATERSLAWSPDGSKIAFTRYEQLPENPSPTDNLYVYDILTAQEIPLAYNAHNPTWSPDSAQVIYGANCALWAVASTGGPSMPLVAQQAGCSHHFPGLDRSPVANQYVYHQAGADDPGLKLLTINADGSANPPQTLVVGYHKSPSWSPDGTRVVYGHSNDPVPSFSFVVHSLRILNVQTGQSVIIPPANFLPPFITDYQPDWGGTWSGICPAGMELRSNVCQLPPTIFPTLIPFTDCTALVTTPVNIRSGPGDTFALISSVSNGITVNILGRTQSQSWMRVQKREDGIVGFSIAAALTLQGNCNNLPVFSDDGLPLPTNTPTPTLTPSRTPDPNISPTPTPTPATRLVETQAISFHANAARFGLPQPFNLWPVVEEDTFQNGYGPNWFANNQGCATPVPTRTPTPVATTDPGIPAPTSTPDPCPYRGVNSIHPGLDYHTDPESSIVVALCDGIIVPGRREPRPGFTNDPYGGSAVGGWGLTLRCFADDPNDTDNDGLRNLSNVIVVYNHLSIDQGVSNEQHPSDGRYQIVYAGQPLATSDASGTNDIHLDLQMYIADGHRSQNAIQFNPRFMNPLYSRVDIASTPRPENEQQPYPDPYNDWSLQGRLEGAGRGSTHFWTQPLAEPFLYDLAVSSYLESRYPPGTRYTGPNCANLPSDVDVNEAWWNSPSRIVECIVPAGLGDA